MPGIPQGSTLLAFHDNDNVPLDDSPGAVLTIPQEGQENQVYRGTWIQNDNNIFTGIERQYGRLAIEDRYDHVGIWGEVGSYRGIGNFFRGFDGQFGELTYENEDVYIGHIQEDVEQVDVLNPLVGDTYTRGDVVYTYGQINFDTIQLLLPGVPQGTTLSAFHYNDNAPLENSPAAVLMLSPQEGQLFDIYQGYWRYRAPFGNQGGYQWPGQIPPFIFTGVDGPGGMAYCYGNLRHGDRTLTGPIMIVMLQITNHY